MEPNTALDLIEKNRIHHFLLLLPLITFILFKQSLAIILLYTVLFAFLEVYFLFLSALRNLATEKILHPIKLDKEQLIGKNLKERINLVIKFIKEQFWFIPYSGFFIIVITLFLVSFGYSFYLSIINLSRNNYDLFVLLAHVFFAPFIAFLYIGFLHFQKVIQKIKEKNNKK